MLFHTTREAYSYAQRTRKEKEKDIVVFETKTAFGVCFENEFLWVEESYILSRNESERYEMDLVTKGQMEEYKRANGL